ncbi:MAG: Crp/Fnr family transcriptional regulator [Ruminococcus sp.]|nr:Crp/Fnr family transcriptional regulator [Ruminococcus sp.]
MKKYYSIMKSSLPFKDFGTDELEYVVKKLNLSLSSFPKGAVIFSQGDTVTHAGVILEGSVIAESVSYSGERRIIQTHSEGALFGDVLMSSQSQPTPVSVIAREDSSVVFLSFESIAENACDPLCRRVLTNMLHGIADKFWELNRKIAYLSCRALRGRIAMFLLDMQKKHQSSTFHLPYSREELASVLGVNRTALSRELSRMQQEEILSFYKSSFKITNAEKLRNCIGGN